MRKTALIAFSVLLIGFCCRSQETPVTMGSIRGDVFTKDKAGERSVLPATHVALHGAVEKETQSDQRGAYSFDSVPPGTYILEATAPGLNATLEVEVSPGAAATAPLELNVVAVNSTVTVTGNDPAPVAESAQSTTIAQRTVETAPNQNERFESLLPLVPGVVRGPDGRINMKGAQSTQAGWLVNSANVTDPATGEQAINLPIDVVSSVQVISNPYDPEYGKFTGAISSVETRTSNFEKFHVAVQNLVPRARDRDGHIVGIGAFTPRVTFTGPLLKDRIAFTQSFEYRFVRTPVESLPPLQRDTKLESFDSFSQLDLKINDQQTATVSLAVFPQKFDYLGLNTFTPQPSTPDLHQRGYQASVQHRLVTESGGLLSSQVSYERFNADVLPNSTDPYRLLVETTEGGFFNRQNRQSDRVEWQEVYQASPRHFYGIHELKAGIDFSHSSYDGRQQFLPADIVGTAGFPLERIEFGAPTTFSVDQNEIAWFVGDEWKPGSRLTFDLGLRFDRDSVTDSTHAAPRAGFTLALTGDGRTLLKAGAGLFYDRVPLNIPVFPRFPDRTVLALDSSGQIVESTSYANVITGGIRNPKSEAWNVELDRQVLSTLLVRVAYQQRNTVNDFVVTPLISPNSAQLSLANRGRDFYREFQVTGRYQIHRHTLNASYVRSQASADLNDFNQFFGNDPQAVIQPNGRGRLPFDAPNRFLAWGEIAAPWKMTVMPVFDLHTGFPYSVENQLREFVGPRNDQRFPRFNSFDIQALKEIRVPFRGKEHRVKVGFGVFNLFNHFNPRDVQNDLDSSRFGDFFNGPNRTFRGKFVFGF
jgi:TonB dependent receptor/Carboxypeptidase regulatory-like domain